MDVMKIRELISGQPLTIDVPTIFPTWTRVRTKFGHLLLRSAGPKAQQHLQPPLRMVWAYPRSGINLPAPVSFPVL
jgi:hypothetical protein